MKGPYHVVCCDGLSGEPRLDSNVPTLMLCLDIFTISHCIPAPQHEHKHSTSPEAPSEDAIGKINNYRIVQQPVQALHKRLMRRILVDIVIPILFRLKLRHEAVRDASLSPPPR